MKKFLKVLSILIIVIAVLMFAFFITTYKEKNSLEDKIHLAKGSSFVKLSSGMTEYEISGPEDGEPVVLIHGFSVPMYDWDYQFNYLADNGYRVLRYNHFGRGFSDRPDISYSKALYIEQLKEIVDKNFKDKVILIGHSFGGGIASEFTSRNPNRVSKLILISPVLNPGKDNLGVTLIRLPVLGDYLSQTIIAPITTKRAAAQLERSTENSEKYKALFNLQTTIKGYNNAVKSLFRDGAFGSYENAYNNIALEDVLLIWGDEDGSVSKDDTQRIISLLPNVEKRVYHGVGHAPNMEIHETVNRDILTFLE